MLQLYIEITNSKLLIAKLIESKTDFYLFDIKNIKLNNLEHTDNLLFNLSSVFLHIKNYLKQNNIKSETTFNVKAEAIVCLPNLKFNVVEKKSFNQNLYVLQASLLISKSGLKIKKIIGSKILKKGNNMPYKFFFAKKEIANQLNFFKQLQPPQKTSPKSWLYLTIFLAISYTFFFARIQNDKKIELENLTQRNAELGKKLNPLPEQIKKLQELKIMNVKLEKKISKIHKSKNKTNNPLDILTHISENIPENCKLTKINISSKTKNSKKKKILLLEGITQSQETITDFTNKLSKHAKLAKTKVINIKKTNKVVEKSEKTLNVDEYLFKISCNIQNT